MQVVKTTNRKEEIKERNLSIQFSLDGFSFCVRNSSNDILCLEKEIFPTTLNSAEDLLLEIQKAFRQRNELQEDFKEIRVIHENSLSTLVPNDYFDQKKLANYLDYTIKTLPTDYITFDDLEVISAKNVYIPYVNINNYLFHHFGEFTFQHHKSLLIEKLIHNNVGENCYVHVGKTLFDIVYFKDQELLFSNSFHYHSKEDFMYYLLFCLEQLKLDTNEIDLVLLGHIEKDSSLYKDIYKFIKKVSFLNPKRDEKDDNSSSAYSNYILLSS